MNQRIKISRNFDASKKKYVEQLKIILPWKY